MSRARFLVLVIAGVGGALIGPARASAHDMKAVVTVAQDHVKVVAYFEDDFPAEFATAQVTDSNGNEIASGKTDETGLWTFVRPAPGEYTLVAKSMGHTARVKFAVAGDPEPTTFTGWRLNKTLGVSIGVVGLLGFSVAYWWFRLRRN
ncbi:MAG: hypothetical protein L0241_26435 [Planctomycetia bacterium]|nr:hypothetical protein [Planctomycetia bacterium]